MALISNMGDLNTLIEVVLKKHYNHIIITSALILDVMWGGW